MNCMLNEYSEKIKLENTSAALVVSTNRRPRRMQKEARVNTAQQQLTQNYKMSLCIVVVFSYYLFIMNDDHGACTSNAGTFANKNDPRSNLARVLKKRGGWRSCSRLSCFLKKRCVLCTWRFLKKADCGRLHVVALFATQTKELLCSFVIKNNNIDLQEQ